MTNSILDSIGNTPIVEIANLNPNKNVKIYAKLEFMNPGGSVKDRVALFMINEGEKTGELKRNKIVLEATSGNTGIGLALICAAKGYELILAMAESVSLERRQILKALGAKLLLTPARLSTDGAIEEIYNMARENPDKYFMTDQFNNPANWKAHYHTTAKEVFEQTDGKVTKFIATMGTTGTLMGVSKRLKEYNPDIQIVGVEPYIGHKIQGLKNLKESYNPEIFDKNFLDKKVNIEDDKAFETARLLAKKEGIFAGMSSGAALAAAIKEAENMNEGVIVVIIPDGGERYLSTPLFMPRKKISLKLFSPLTKQKEPLLPNKENEVSIYSCGHTLYRRMHLGECRRYVFADILCRYLEFKRFDVKHIVGIIDLDDNIIEALKKNNILEFTQKELSYFKEDLKKLNIKPADKYPLSSEHIKDMENIATKLVKKGVAYEKLRSLYFDISKVKDYGKLSGIDLNKIRLGATVDLDEYEKDNPRDFTLFKRAKLSDLKKGVYASTEWGNVRPSLHLQCAAMSIKYLGENFDIHTGCCELIFPHHENKNAIAKSLSGEPLAKYWLNCEGACENGKKINKAKKDNITIDDLIEKGYSGEEIRFWFMSSHYRKLAVFSSENIEHHKKALERLNSFIHSLYEIDNKSNEYQEIAQLVFDIKKEFEESMDDDMNISGAIASIFSNIKKINKLIYNNKLNSDDCAKLVLVFKKIDSVLKIMDFNKPVLNDIVKNLIKQREEARKNKNWQLADKIREKLLDMRIEVKDKKF
jgi:cysteinyl-tRNA synthetase